MERINLKEGGKEVYQNTVLCTTGIFIPKLVSLKILTSMYPND